ncbi:MAG: hypothetical protein ACXIUO_11990 [Erythrobacter sp.]
MTQLRIPYVEKIWRVEDSLIVDEPLTPAEAFERLDPLFQTDGTRYAIEGDTLGYLKTNPRAQDKLATFTSGTLRVEPAEGGTRLSYQAASTALLLAFLAPLFFLFFAQVMEAANQWERAKAEVSEGTKDTKKADTDKGADKPVRKLHPIDVMLGAPAPKDPNADKDKKEEPKDKFRTTPAYVLAGLFVAIFLVGRVLEPWLLKRTFRQALTAPTPVADGAEGGVDEPDPAFAAPV